MHYVRMVNIRTNMVQRQLSATTSFNVYYAIDSANKKKMSSSYSLTTLNNSYQRNQRRGWWGNALIAADPLSKISKMSSSFYPKNCFPAPPPPPSHCRALSTLPPAAAAGAGAAAAAAVGMTEGEFHKIADATLFELFDIAAVLEDSVNADTSLTQGILTIDLSSLKKGVWVINKQAPNRQIWWSSPISGPRRYEHDHNHSHSHSHNIKSLGECWKSSKNNYSALLSDLRSEMLKATDINI